MGFFEFMSVWWLIGFIVMNLAVTIWKFDFNKREIDTDLCTNRLQQLMDVWKTATISDVLTVVGYSLWGPFLLIPFIIGVFMSIEEWWNSNHKKTWKMLKKKKLFGGNNDS